MKTERVPMESNPRPEEIKGGASGVAAEALVILLLSVALLVAGIVVLSSNALFDDIQLVGLALLGSSFAALSRLPIVREIVLTSLRSSSDVEKLSSPSVSSMLGLGRH